MEKEKNPFEKSALFEVSDTGTDTAAKNAALRTAIIRSIISALVLVVIIIAIVFSIRYLPQLFSSFSSFLSFFKSNKITLSVSPQPVKSLDLVTIKIKHSPVATSTPAAYSFNYGCVTDFRFEVPAQASSTPGTVLPCNTTIFTASSTPITLRPILSKGTTASVPFVVAYTLQGTTTPTSIGSTTIKITAPAATTTPPATTPTTTYPTYPTTTTPTQPKPVDSRSDVAIAIFARGVIEPNGQFSARSNISPGERAAVRFQVMNTGGSASGAYTITASLPSSENPTYTSELKPSLAPGYSATYTMSFVFNPNVNNRQVIISANPQSNNEITQTNNIGQLGL